MAAERCDSQDSTFSSRCCVHLKDHAKVATTDRSYPTLTEGWYSTLCDCCVCAVRCWSLLL